MSKQPRADAALPLRELPGQPVGWGRRAGGQDGVEGEVRDSKWVCLLPFTASYL